MNRKEGVLFLLALLMILLILSIIGCSGSPDLPTLVPTAVAFNEFVDIVQPSPTIELLPTATLGRTVEEALAAEIKAELDDYDYEQQQILIEQIEIRGNELIVRIQRRGSPSLKDYFGQLVLDQTGLVG